MSQVYADRVQETTATSGTGTLSLSGAVTQSQGFVAAVGSGNTCDYCILSGNGTDWEVGNGTVTSGSPNTLSRTTIFASSNSGSAISLTGTSTVFLTFATYRWIRRFTASKTTTYAILASDSGTHFDDIGSGGATKFELPAAASGLTYTLTDFTGDGPYFQAAGTDVIYAGANVTSGGGTATSGAAYSSLTIEAHGTGIWVSTATIGEWAFA